MSDTQPNAQSGAQMMINGQYVKDLSFEVPNAPAIFAELSRTQPEIPINIDIEGQKLNENSYEVVLKIHIEAKVADKVAFIAELAYAGIFTLQGVPQEHIQPMLLIECPRLLFPFARNIIADVTRDGGFPPLMMQPIDFVALFRQRLAAQKANGGDDQPTATA